MLSLIKKFFCCKEKYQIRVVELELGNGSKRYAPQMTCVSVGKIKWGGIILSGNTFNSFSKCSYLSVIDDYPKHTVKDKQTAWVIAREFKEHVMADIIVSSSVVECCEPRKIN